MFCTHCGKELDDGSKFCIYCGERLEEDPAETPAAEQTAAAVNAAAEEAKEAVSEAAEEAKDTVTEAAAEVKETVAEVKDTVTDAAAQANEASAETAEKAQDAAAQTAENVTDAIVPAAGGAAKTIDVSSLLKNKKALVIAGAAVAVLLLIIIIAGVAASAGGSSEMAVKGTYYLNNDAGECTVFYNGKEVKGTDLSPEARIAAASADGSRSVVADGGDTLYYLNGDKASKITEDFDNTFIIMSADGNAVCYAFDDTLYLYKDGKSSKVAEIETRLSAAVISPNGDTVVYSEIEGDKISAFAWKGGKVIDLDAKITPISVCNGGGIIYGRDKNSKLSYIKNLKPDSAESVRAMKTSAYPALSYDKKQILFTGDNGGVYYFDSSVKEDIKVSGDGLSIIYPEGSARSMTSFKSFIAYSDGKVYKFTRKGDDFEKDSLTSFSNGYKLSADGKTLVYLQGGNLYRTSVSDSDKKTLIADEVESFDADDSLKNVYFVNEDDALRYADGKSKSGKKIMDDVSRYIVTPDGVCVFVNEDDELQYSAKGGDKQKAGLEDVEGIYEVNGVVYVNSDGDLHISTDGKKFNKS